MPKHQFMIGQSRMAFDTAVDEFGPVSTEYAYPDSDGSWPEVVERDLQERGFRLEWQPSISLHWDANATPDQGDQSGHVQMFAEVGADEILRAAAFIARERAAGYPINSFAFPTASLTRRDLNDGIRAMRRARNAIFGSDE
jgi:hypothetical protein